MITTKGSEIEEAKARTKQNISNKSLIRNFVIIAHIDHGKSTLADRLLQKTNTITQREFRDQLLDDMDLERERGITIKASAVNLRYVRDEPSACRSAALVGVEYSFNLIDTPGHVDFHYEVSRSLVACEGALLLVDAAQGIEAQTVANVYLAMEHDLTIIPVINKIDLQQARPLEVMEEMESVLGIDPEDVLLASAKLGTGVEEIMDAIVDRIPPPKGDSEAPLRALIFDSIFNDYRGVIVYIRVFDGTIESGQEIRMMKTGKTFEVDEVGIFTPKMQPTERLSAGEVGYCIANIRSVQHVKIGDTITDKNCAEITPLPGYREPLPMVFCGVYPAKDTDFYLIRDALERLQLNDSSFTFEPETSEALGLGFRCGFLGMLHKEIVQERLERESNVDLVQTAPNVTYEVLLKNGDVIKIDNPSKLPQTNVEEIREPVVRVNLITPIECIGTIMQLADDRRGKYVKTEYISHSRVVLIYDLPLAEMVYDFYDKLKSATKGYGTMDYDLLGYQPSNLVKLDVLVGGRKVDALSCIVHKDEAEFKGRKLVKRLKEEIPRHLFQIPIQAAIGSRVIARETIPPLSKHVTGKCYGGDITRKRKLWEKQKEGKKRMKSVGRVEIPQEAFLAILGKES